MVQRQPTSESAGGRVRLQAGRQSTSTVSQQGTGSGGQHNTVSTRLHGLHVTVFLFFFYIPVTAYDFLVFLTARDAEKTASPNQEQEKHPKASPGRVTQTRREKGDYNFRLKTNNPLMVYLTLSITLPWVIDAFQDDLSFLSLHNLFCIHCPLWFNRTAANTNPSLYKGGRRKK